MSTLLHLLRRPDVICCGVLTSLAWLVYAVLRFCQEGERTEYFLKDEREEQQ